MNRDANLYFSTPGPVTIHAPQPIDCALGQVVYAGTKWGSQATHAHAPPPDFFRPTPHYLLVYTLEGEADYVDDTGVKTVLRKGTLMWTRPGVNQSYGPRPGRRWSEFFMWFGGALFDCWQTQGYPGAQSRLLLLEPVDYWLGRFAAIVQPAVGTPVETPLVRLCRLQQLLAEALQAEAAGRQTAATLVWRETVCKRLAAGTLTSPALTGLAREMNMSYSSFRERFLHLTGKTPGQYRSGEILRRACRRLMEGDDPVYRIAAELGFHDPFHFSRRFKQAIGLSPKEFRRQVPRP